MMVCMRGWTTWKSGNEVVDTSMAKMPASEMLSQIKKPRQRAHSVTKCVRVKQASKFT